MSSTFLVGAGILLFVFGLGLGYGLSYLLRSREASKASDIQNELDEYRQNVTEHFSETAQHFQALGQQYRSLYKHMAHGAEALCDPAQADGLLEFAAAETAALTARADDREAAPEPIRDYAPEESESVEVEASAEERQEPEPAAATDAEDELPVESAADDEIADAMTASTPDDTERTVH